MEINVNTVRKGLAGLQKPQNRMEHDFPEISQYALVIHCGACMTNRREILSRILIANEKNVPITNYGIAISYCLDILLCAMKIFN